MLNNSLDIHNTFLIHLGASAAAFVYQTHKAPAAAVGCYRGDRREQPTIQRTAAKPFRPLAPHKADAYKRKAGLHLIDINRPAAFWTSTFN